MKGFVRGLIAQVPGGSLLLENLPILVACALLTPLAAGLAHLVSTPSFVSQSRILLKLGREFMAPVGTTGRAASMYRLNEAINSEIEILSSHELAEDVLREFTVAGLFPELAEEIDEEEVLNQKAAEVFLESLSVTAVTESSVIRVALAHEDPVLARDALARLLASFQTRHLGVFTDSRIQQAKDEVALANRNLAQAEDERMRYWEESGVFDPTEERALLLRRREAVQGVRRELATQLAQLERPEDAEDTAGDTPNGDPQLEEQLLALRSEEVRLLNNYYPTSVAVQTVQSQIAALEMARDESKATRLAALRGQVEGNDVTLASIEQQLGMLQGYERRLREIARVIAAAEQHQLAATSALRYAEAEARLDAELVTSVKVIDKPTLPLKPVGIGLAPKLVLGLLAGLLLGVSAILGLHLSTRPGPIPPEENVPARP